MVIRYVLYFVFKPMSLVGGMLALVVPLLRLFDISNMATGSTKRALTRLSRAIVAFVCASCFAVSFISCWYAADVSSKLRIHYLTNSQALCLNNSSPA